MNELVRPTFDALEPPLRSICGHRRPRGLAPPVLGEDPDPEVQGERLLAEVAPVDDAFG